VRTAAGAARALEEMIEADAATPILVAGSLFLVGEVLAEELRRTGRASVLDLSTEACP
jgi:hypothetical protein